MRPHFVRATVRVHLYPDGSHALFHGPNGIGRYDAPRRLNPLDGPEDPYGDVDDATPRPHPHKEQNQDKRTDDVPPKLDTLIRY
jgi:hypothetical protein